MSNEPRGELKRLVDFINDVKALDEMAERYGDDTPHGQAIAQAAEAFDRHFRTLDTFFGKTPFVPPAAVVPAPDPPAPTEQPKWCLRCCNTFHPGSECAADDLARVAGTHVDPPVFPASAKPKRRSKGDL